MKDPVEFVRYALDLWHQGIGGLPWLRMNLMILVRRLTAQRTAGAALAAELAELRPNSPALAQWAATFTAVCPEEELARRSPRAGLPDDPGLRAMALLSLAEPMATALREIAGWLDREIDYRQRRAWALGELLERRHAVATALKEWERSAGEDTETRRRGDAEPGTPLSPALSPPPRQGEGEGGMKQEEGAPA